MAELNNLSTTGEKTASFPRVRQYRGLCATAVHSENIPQLCKTGQARSGEMWIADDGSRQK
jgi:hypothetical protein